MRRFLLIGSLIPLALLLAACDECDTDCDCASDKYCEQQEEGNDTCELANDDHPRVCNDDDGGDDGGGSSSSSTTSSSSSTNGCTSDADCGSCQKCLLDYDNPDVSAKSCKSVPCGFGCPAPMYCSTLVGYCCGNTGTSSSSTSSSSSSSSSCGVTCCSDADCKGNGNGNWCHNPGQSGSWCGCASQDDCYEFDENGNQVNNKGGNQCRQTGYGVCGCGDPYDPNQCTGNTNGSRCLNEYGGSSHGTCGCTSNSDCPSGVTCNTTTGKCGSSSSSQNSSQSTASTSNACPGVTCKNGTLDPNGCICIPS